MFNLKFAQGLFSFQMCSSGGGNLKMKVKQYLADEISQIVFRYRNRMQLRNPQVECSYLRFRPQ